MTELFSALVNLSVVVFAVSSMLSVGFGHTVQEIVGPLRNVGAVLRALVANFVLVPLLAVIVLQVFSLDQPLAIGLFLVATAAGAPFLIKLTEVAESDLALSAALLVLLLPATIVYMPIVIPLALPEAKISAGAIAGPLVMTMLLPLAIGLLIRAWATAWALRLQPLMGKLSSLALVVLVLATILQNLPGILSVLLTSAILAALIVIGGAFVIGYLLGGRSRRSREVLGLGTSQRNIAAATVVATQAVGHPDTITMVVVTSLVAFAVLFPVAGLLRRRPDEPAGAAGRTAQRGPDGE